MNRRGFLAAMLAMGASPAVVKSESLMRVTGIRVATDDEIVALLLGRFDEAADSIRENMTADLFSDTMVYQQESLYRYLRQTGDPHASRRGR